MPAIVMTDDAQRQPTDGMTISPGAEQAAATVLTTIAGS